MIPEAGVLQRKEVYLVLFLEIQENSARISLALVRTFQLKLNIVNVIMVEVCTRWSHFTVRQETRKTREGGGSLVKELTPAGTNQLYQTTIHPF